MTWHCGGCQRKRPESDAPCSKCGTYARWRYAGMSGPRTFAEEQQRRAYQGTRNIRGVWV